MIKLVLLSLAIGVTAVLDQRLIQSTRRLHPGPTFATSTLRLCETRMAEFIRNNKHLCAGGRGASAANLVNAVTTYGAAFCEPQYACNARFWCRVNTDVEKCTKEYLAHFMDTVAFTMQCNARQYQYTIRLGAAPNSHIYCYINDHIRAHLHNLFLNTPVSQIQAKLDADLRDINANRVILAQVERAVGLQRPVTLPAENAQVQASLMGYGYNGYSRPR